MFNIRKQFYNMLDAMQYMRRLKAKGYEPTLYEAYNYQEQRTVYTVDAQ